MGWSISWFALRVLTLGRYPEERLGGVDEAGTYTALLEEVGLADAGGGHLGVGGGFSMSGMGSMPRFMKPWCASIGV